MNRLNKVCVYQHKKLNGEVFYIGIGTEKRPYSKNNRTKFWHDIVNKHNYVVEILYENLTYEEANKIEIELISFYGRRFNKTGTLCNITEGGGGKKGVTPSKETIEKIRNKLKGKPLTKEHSLKIKLNHSKHMLGKTHSDETKEKLRNIQLGKKHSKETLRKMSNTALLKGRTKEHYNNLINSITKKIINIETNEIFNSVKSAANSIGQTQNMMSRRLRGNRPNNTPMRYYEE